MQFASQGRQVCQDKPANDQEENRVPNKVIVRTAEHHPKRNAKRRPNGTQPIEREPENPK
jgi:hypothetical protein